MNPEEIEFIGEKMSIGIIPNFNFEPIHLISNTIGRLRILKLFLVYHTQYFDFRSFQSWSTHVCSSLACSSYEEATEM